MENNRWRPPVGQRCCPSPEQEEKPECHKERETLSLAMAYVPWQRYTDSFDLAKALQVGTLFPELCKPFCGKCPGRRV